MLVVIICVCVRAQIKIRLFSFLCVFQICHTFKSWTCVIVFAHWQCCWLCQTRYLGVYPVCFLCNKIKSFHQHKAFSCECPPWCFFFMVHALRQNTHLIILCPLFQHQYLTEALHWRAQTDPDHVLFVLLNAKVPNGSH